VQKGKAFFLLSLQLLDRHYTSNGQKNKKNGVIL